MLPTRFAFLPMGLWFLSASPGALLAQRVLADTVAKGDWREVTRLAASLKKDGASSHVANWLKGYADVAAGDYNSATAEFSKLQGPGSDASLYNWAREALTGRSSNPWLLLLFGDALARMEDFDNSLSALDAAAAVEPDSVLILNSRGTVRAKAGLWDLALADFQRAEQLESANAGTRANLGVVRLQLGELGRAADDFTKAIAAAPGFALAYHGRAVAHAHLGYLDAAITDLTEARRHHGFSDSARLDSTLQSVLHERARLALRNQLQKLGNPEGGVPMQFAFDEGGRIAAIRDTHGLSAHYDYDAFGRLSRISHDQGRWVEYQYSTSGLLREVRIESGAALEYSRDVREGLSVRLPGGDTIRVESEPASRSHRLRFPDGEMVRYGAADQLRGVPTQPGRQAQGAMQASQVALELDERNRVISILDEGERTRLRWDSNGRLESASTNSGLKALVRWDEATGKVHSLTTSFGAVEFDREGRPRDLLTLEGARISANWGTDGQLREFLTPTAGAIRPYYDAATHETQLWFADGLSMTLDSSRARPDPIRQAEMRDRMLRYQFERPTPQLPTSLSERSGRFWRRVENLLERSQRLPHPGSGDYARNEEYWTSGAWKNDPYYVDVARPAPDLSPQNFLKATALTMGVILCDWARAGVAIAPRMPRLEGIDTDWLVRPVTSNLLSIPRDAMIAELSKFDQGYITGNLNQAAENMKKATDFVGAVRSMANLLRDSLSISRYSEQVLYSPPTGNTLYMSIGGPTRTLTTSEYVGRTSLGMGRSIVGDTVSVHWVQGLERLAQIAAEETLNIVFDSARTRPRSAPAEPPVSPAPILLRVDFSRQRIATAGLLDAPRWSRPTPPQVTRQDLDPGVVMSTTGPGKRGGRGGGITRPPSWNPPPVHRPPPPNQPRPGGAPPPGNRPSAGTKRMPSPPSMPSIPQPNSGGVLMGAEVVKDRPADLSGIFGNTAPRTSAVSADLELSIPFLLFCANDGNVTRGAGIR